jgi:hypothetical protein
MTLPIDQSGGTCCHHRVTHRYFADHRLPEFGEHNIDDPLRARRSVAIGVVSHYAASQHKDHGGDERDERDEPAGKREPRCRRAVDAVHRPVAERAAGDQEARAEGVKLGLAIPYGAAPGRPQKAVIVSIEPSGIRCA